VRHLKQRRYRYARLNICLLLFACLQGEVPGLQPDVSYFALYDDHPAFPYLLSNESATTENVMDD
jgi:hypothetical protein